MIETIINGYLFILFFIYRFKLVFVACGFPPTVIVMFAYLAP